MNTEPDNERKIDSFPSQGPVASVFKSPVVMGCSFRDHHTAVNALTTDPEEKTMLNKVVVFAIFGPKCIFDASKNSN